MQTVQTHWLLSRCFNCLEIISNISANFLMIGFNFKIYSVTSIAFNFIQDQCFDIMNGDMEDGACQATHSSPSPSSD
jgi:hypothetical protein